MIANRPAIAANTASKPGCFGVGVAVGFFVSGVGVSPLFARLYNPDLGHMGHSDLFP